MRRRLAVLLPVLFALLCVLVPPAALTLAAPTAPGAPTSAAPPAPAAQDAPAAPAAEAPKAARPPWVAKTFMVDMSDGVRLATDVILPPLGDGPWPVILSRTPYGRKMGGGAPQVAALMGYVAVSQDMRGRFDSEGENLPFIGCGWVDHQDGADTVAWVRRQPWCNGKVGTVGGSAGGITQNLMAAAAPEGLVCQYIVVAAANVYTDAAYQGGALRKEQVENWSRQHKFDPKAMEIWREHPAFDQYWHRLDSTRRHDRMNCPALHAGGWFDTFCQGTLDSFVGRQTQGAEGARGAQMLVMGPWTHGGITRGKQGDLTFPGAKPPQQYDLLLWFAHYLKGEDNAVAKAKPVAYYTMGDCDAPDAPGNRWQFADAWPVPATETPFYFYKDGTLATANPPADAPFREYTFDPANPCPTVGGRNLTIPAGPRDQRPVEGRGDVLTFTTEPLEAPVEVTGRLLAKVFVSSSARDTDLSVRLSDVYPDGRSMLMSDGILRLRYRESLEKPVPLEPGKVYEVTVDLWSTSLVFNTGHRIRVAVTSSNHPRFDVNPGTGQPWTEGGEHTTQTNRIYCDAARPSCILLPVAK